MIKKKRKQDKMTLDKLAEIIERTVAKKEDLVDLAKKIDLRKFENRFDRLEEKIDDIQETVNNIDREHLNMQIRIQRLEKHALPNR